jgi:hypothetical protein
MSYVTIGFVSPPCDSVTQQSDTVTGYPEFNFFKLVKLMPAIKDNLPLVKQFKDVVLYTDYKDAKAHNFEGLFSLSNATGGDPDPSSLFNLQTLNLLLNVSANMPDIVSSPMLYLHSLDLSAYTKVTSLLTFTSNEQTYLLYLWMLYCKKFTFERKNDTEDPTYSIIANIGQQAMPQIIG